MNRHDFLRLAASFGFGSLISPFSAFTPKKKVQNVIVIGAGVSGLYLAKKLLESGCEVTVLEAKNRLGGRVFQNDTFHDSPIDLGAQWVHGKNIAYRLAKKHDLRLYEDHKNDLLKVPFKQEMLSDLPPVAYDFIRRVQQQSKSLEDVSVYDFAKKYNDGADFLHLLENLMTDAATSAQKFSVREISKMTSKLRTTDFQFDNATMFGFVSQVLGEAVRPHIRFSTEARAIDYNDKTVRVHTVGGQIFTADKVAVTVPITVLKTGALVFSPALPTEQAQAIQNIGMDKGLKLFLKFSERFFEQGIFNGKNAGYFIDPTKRNDRSGKGMLASLVMGKHAEAYYQDSEKALERYLAELDGYFGGKASQHFEGMLAQDWGHEPFINGVYSYTMPGWQNARTVARQPLNNKVFFAGEAMNTRHNYGNVHGAMESAAATLKEI